ncbi:MAG: hypothetical protein ABIY51_04560 [Ferruginibacter sp.]
MKRQFLLYFLLGCAHALPAQFNTYNIGAMHIGYDSLYTFNIGKATTPRCPFAGPCGNACAVYTFIGAGNWNVEGNWNNFMMPPNILRGCNQVVISPIGNEECLLNIPFQMIVAGASITVMPGKKFRIPGKLDIK